MEQLKPLSEFFAAIENDPRISITHIGIYAALLQYWKKHNYAISVFISWSLALIAGCVPSKVLIRG